MFFNSSKGLSKKSNEYIQSPFRLLKSNKSPFLVDVKILL